MYRDVVVNIRNNEDNKIKFQRVASTDNAAKWKNMLFKSRPEGLCHEKLTAKIT